MGIYISLQRYLDLHLDILSEPCRGTKRKLSNSINQGINLYQNTEMLYVKSNAEYKKLFLWGRECIERFPDLTELPLELSLAVLSHLDATDLCLAGCVWKDLACDEILWMG